MELSLIIECITGKSLFEESQAGAACVFGAQT